jgi:hypothetical protein
MTSRTMWRPPPASACSRKAGPQAVPRNDRPWMSRQCRNAVTTGEPEGFLVNEGMSGGKCNTSWLPMMSRELLHVERSGL